MSSISTKTKKLTKVQSEAIEELKQRRTEKPQAPNLDMDFDDDARELTIRFDAESQLTAYALAFSEAGTTDDRVFDGLLKQISVVGEQGKAISNEASNFVLGVVAGIKPQDDVETLLAAQIAVTHQATMLMGRRLNHVETIQQQDAAERAFNRLARTFTTQMDALKRYRATAQQTVRVERVTVNEGGQAIVGSVQAKGRGDDEK